MDLSLYGSAFWVCRVGPGFSDRYLLLPQRYGLSAMGFRVRRVGPGLALEFLSAPEPLAELGVVSYLDAVEGQLLSAYSLTGTYVLAVGRSGWDWLWQLRVQGSAVTGVYQSAQVSAVVQGRHGRCDGVGCEGCPNLLLNRLCLAYSACALGKCVGTPVHQRRPLCGMGQVVAFSGRMAVTAVQGGWTILIEVFMQTLQATLSPSKRFDLAFPEDSFMCFVCTAKVSRVIRVYSLSARASARDSVGQVDAHGAPRDQDHPHASVKQHADFHLAFSVLVELYRVGPASPL